MNDKDKKTITDSFVKILNIHNELERKPKDYGTGELIHVREIHLIQTIGQNKNIYLTKLAQLTGVTKGAISQNLSKLERKGYVEKIRDPKNNSKNLIRLTNKGKIAYFGHEHYHEKVDRNLMNYLEKVENNNAPFLIELFSKLEGWIHECLVTER